MNRPDDRLPGVPMGRPSSDRPDRSSARPAREVRESDLLPPGFAPPNPPQTSPQPDSPPAEETPPSNDSPPKTANSPLAPGPHVVAPKHVSPKPASPAADSSSAARASPSATAPKSPFDEEEFTAPLPTRPVQPVAYYGPPPQQSEGSLTAIIVLSTIALCLLMVCGGIGGAAYWVFSTWTSREITVPDPSPSPPPSPTIQPAADPFYSPTSDWKPEDVDSALRALRSQQDLRIQQGADYLASAAADETHQAEISQALAARLNHRSPEIRRLVMAALDRWRHENAAPAVLDALRAGRFDPNEAKQAIEWLGVWQYHQATEELAARLGDPVLGDAAQQALSRLGSTARPVLVDLLVDSDSQLASRAERLLQGYGVDVKDERLSAHIRALAAAGSSQRQRSADWLAEQQLDSTRQDEAARALDKALSADAGVSRDEVLRAIEVWGDERSVPGLMKVLESDGQRGDDVLQVLKAMDTPASTMAIASLLANLVYADEAEKILLARGAAAKTAVLAYVHDESTSTRIRARKVATELGITQQEIVAQSFEDLKSAKQNRQIAAAEWLAEIDGGDYPAHQRAAIAAQLTRLMSSDHSFTRAAAAKAIVQWATIAEASQLLALLGSDDHIVAVAALEALLGIDDSSLSKKISVYLPDMFGRSVCREPAIAALQKAGDKSEDAVIDLVSKNYEVDVITAAVRVLGMVGTEDSVTKLTEMASEAGKAGYPDLQKLAREAIRAIKRRKKTPTPK